MTQETTPNLAVAHYLGHLRDYCTSLQGLLITRNVSSPDFGNNLTSLDAHLLAGKILSPSLTSPIDGLVSAVERYSKAVRQLLPQLQEQNDAAYTEASTLMTSVQGVIEGFECIPERALKAFTHEVRQYEATQGQSSPVPPPYTTTGKAEGAQKPVDSGGPKRRRGRPPKPVATQT